MSGLWIRGISCSAIISLIEWQKTCLCSIQERRHVNFVIAHGEVNQRPVGKRKQRFSRLPLRFRISIHTILVDRVTDTLCEVCLEFRRCNGNAIQKQHQIDIVFILKRVMHLPDNSKSIGGISCQNIQVDGQRRLGLSEHQAPLKPQHFDPTSQYVQCTPLVDLISHTTQ